MERRRPVPAAPRAPTPLKRDTTSVDGVRVVFETDGTGSPTLVFVHGWSCDRSYWRDQLPHFARRHRVVAVDLGGHGESGTERANWTMEAFADDVVATVPGVDTDPVVLIGHSMGGDVIVPAAKTLQSRVIGLVWVDTYRRLGRPRTREQIDAELQSMRDDFAGATKALVRRMSSPSSDPALVDWIAADMASAPPAIAIDALDHVISYERPLLRLLKEIAAPVVAINASVRPTDAESLAEHGVSTVVMTGVGHFLMMEDPPRFNQILEDVITGFTA